MLRPSPAPCSLPRDQASLQRCPPGQPLLTLAVPLLLPVPFLPPAASLFPLQCKSCLWSAWDVLPASPSQWVCMCLGSGRTKGGELMWGHPPTDTQQMLSARVWLKWMAGVNHLSAWEGLPAQRWQCAEVSCALPAVPQTSVMANPCSAGLTTSQGTVRWPSKYRSSNQTSLLEALLFHEVSVHFPCYLWSSFKNYDYLY